MEKDDDEESAAAPSNAMENSVEFEQDSTAPTMHGSPQPDDVFVSARVESQCEFEPESVSELNVELNVDEAIESSLLTPPAVVGDEVVVDGEGRVGGGEERVVLNVEMRTEVEVVSGDAVEREMEGSEEQLEMVEMVKHMGAVDTSVEMKGSEEHWEVVDGVELTGVEDLVADTKVASVDIIPRAEDEEVVDVGEHANDAGKYVQENTDFDCTAEDRWVAELVDNKEIGEEACNTEITDDLCNSEIADIVGNVEIAGAKDSKVADAAEDAQMADAAEDAQVTGAAEDAHVTDAAEDAQVADAAEDAQVTDAAEDAQVADAAEDAQVTDAAQDAQVTDAPQDTLGADAVQDAQVADGIEDTQIADGIKDAQIDDTAVDAQLADAVHETEDADAVHESKDAQVADAVQETEDADAVHESKDAQVADAVEDVLVPDAAEDALVANAAEDALVAYAAKDAQVADAAEDAQVADVVHETEDAQVADAVHETEDAQVADAAEEPHVADAVENAQVSDAAEYALVADAAEGAQVADVTKDSLVVDAAKDAQVADVAEDSLVAAAVEDAQVADAAEDAQIGDAAEDGQVADALHETKDADAVHETEGSDAGYDTEVADAGDDMEVPSTLEDMEVTEADEDMGVAEADEETELTEEAVEMELTDTAKVTEEASESTGGKRKRGRQPKVMGRVLTRKKAEEDVCFICFDGGNLVLCDRRGCPKAYHPSCVNHDEAFFRSKGRWNCGWHLCSKCEKNAYYMCYTCTFSLCKGCIKNAVILCVRGNKGFCETCMKTVMMIERNEQAQVDFDDKSSWEYLFKDYWMDLKQRLSITMDEVTRAKNPWKGSDVHGGKEESSGELYGVNNDAGSSSDSAGNAETSIHKRRKPKKRTKSHAKDEVRPSTSRVVCVGRASSDDRVAWASNELLEFVMHMRNGDKSFLSQFDVQALLLEYIKRNKLRDPRRKSQIICDLRLQNLFGKPRVGHFEMLKLLESHFLVKEDSQTDDFPGSVVDTEANQLEADGNTDVLIKASRDKKRKSRRKGDERGLQYNREDYAAIDIHNINLIYLRRSLVEELIEDPETLHEKVVGAFVRIRISGSGQKQDLYRLVQVVGTTKATEPYKVGKRTTDTMLEILNLNKTEIVPVDIISNQEFTEDECKRLRQSIKCGLINRLTVGDIQEKAIALQAVRVKDWLEAEILRLSHLRDRASEKGRRKELRECVEKLQFLKTPEERQRRLEEIPEIHADPNMDPSHESDEDDGEADEKKQENFLRPRGSGYSRRAREPVSPRKLGSASNDSWGGTRNYSAVNRELTRNTSSKGLLSKGNDFTGSSERMNENSWNQGRDGDTQSNSRDKLIIASNIESGGWNSHSVIRSESSGAVSENSSAAVSTGVPQSAAKISETEKEWHYRDPAGKIQGPFSMGQLRKWNTTGYFPTDLKIWKITDKEDNSILLSDALAGKIPQEQALVQMVHSPNLLSYSGKPYGTPLQQGIEGQAREWSNLEPDFAALNPHGSLGPSVQSAGQDWRAEPKLSSLKSRATPSVEVPKYSDYNRNDSTNLPSPTPTQSTTEETKLQAYEIQWSPKSFPVKSAGSVFGDNLHSPTPGSTFSPQNSFTRNNKLNAMEYLGAVVTPVSNSVRESAQVSEFVSSTSLPGVGLSPAPEGGMLSVSTNARQIPSQSAAVPSESHSMVNARLLSALGISDASVNLSADTATVGATFQNFVPPVSNQHPPAETHAWGPGASKPGPTSIPGNTQAWGSGPSQKVEPNNPITMPAEPSAYGHWVGTPTSIHNSASSLRTGNTAAMFPTPGFSGFPSSDTWRPTGPSQQPNIQPHGVPNPAWGMGASDPSSTAARPQNWGTMPGDPNMGWRAMVPGNMNWGVPGQGPPAPQNANPGWLAPGQAPPPGNTNAGWVPNSQGPPPVNPNLGWGAPGQGPAVPGSTNPRWATPTGNTNDDRFSSQRGDRSRGGDSGYSRQQSFGSRVGGSSRPIPGGQRVCEYHKSGHCKKGAACDYLHT